MSYLSILAARALDQPQPIRPLLQSLFEPIAGPHINFREVTLNQPNKQQPRKSPWDAEQGSARHNSDPAPSSIRPKEIFTSAEAVSHRASGRPQSIKSISESAQTVTEPKHFDERGGEPLSAKRRIETANEPAAEPRSVDAATSSVGEAIKPHVQIAQAITIEQTNVIETERDAVLRFETRETKSQQPDAPRVQSIVVKPDVTTDRSESAIIQPQLLAPDSPPTVKITIGRVDVRAIMPPVQSTVTVARQPAMKALSLDDYLKQRNGEQR